MTLGHATRLNIAVVGAGIAGMSAAWLLSRKHDVTVYEKQGRLGGHSNTVEVDTAQGVIPVDTGFIVYNNATYPNLTALFAHLGVETRATEMSFGVSLDGGAREYSTVGASAFLCGGRNLLSPRFYSMLWDLQRFYRKAPLDFSFMADGNISLGDYLALRGYGEAFQRDHILPQAAAIWSASMSEIRSYPACAFVRFFENHGLLKLSMAERPKWRTVVGGSRAYVKRLTAPYADRVRGGAVSVMRDGAGVWVREANGEARRYDHVVIGAHADEALAMLADPSRDERALLGAFRYARNKAVLHTDASLMPRRKGLWASWNYVGDNPEGGCVVSYWMNMLQGFASPKPIFLTLNPQRMPAASEILYEIDYDHPMFDAASLHAQRALWSLQGVRNTWFCGAHFGAGFHEDGLQAGLAVAEQLGGVRRPWIVPNESGRIHLAPPAQDLAA
ncbi:MAG TPA: FAD-dependent oxidoreductase [Caulobacterales bacterium]|nr:FAD-dependent oxidoreductase [Caulobacterales bacterium]